RQISPPAPAASCAWTNDTPPGTVRRSLARGDRTSLSEPQRASSGSPGVSCVIKVRYVLAAISPPERLSRGLHSVGHLIALSSHVQGGRLTHTIFAREESRAIV